MTHNLSKRLLAIVLAVMMVVLAVPFTASAAGAYKLTFDPGDGKLTSGQSEYYLNYGDYYKDVIGTKAPTAELDGYELAGWYYEAAKYWFSIDDYYAIHEDATLHAIWKEKTVTPTTGDYTVTFDANGGTITSGNSKYGINFGQLWKDAIPTAPVATRDGYTFVKWFNEKYQYTLDLSGTATYAINEDCTFKAEWKQGTTPVTPVTGDYVVTFDANGGTITSGNTQYGINFGQLWKDAIPTAPVATRDGYTFVKWFNEKYQYTLDLSGTATYAIKEDCTFKAQWKQGTTPVTPVTGDYVVTFDANGGTITSGNTQYGINYGQAWKDAIPTAPVATRDGYTFVKWFNEKYQYTLDLSGTATYAIKEDCTFKAQWKEGGSPVTPVTGDYVVTFDPNGGTITSGNTQYGINYGQAWKAAIPSAPVAKRDGYTFVKWFNEKYSYTLDLSGTATYAIKEDCTFKAIWKQGDEPTPTGDYKITFDANGGSISGTSVFYINYGQKWNAVIKTAPVATKAGSEFKYWFNEKYSYKLDLSDTAVYSIKEDCTFKAVWKDSTTTFTITFDPNGGTIVNGKSSYEISYGQKYVDVIPKTIKAEKEGATFKGWYYPAANYFLEFSKTATYGLQKDGIFIAAYEGEDLPKEYWIVSFDPDGGEMAEGFETSYKIHTGDVYGDLFPGIAAEKEGYTFKNWYNEKYGYTLDFQDSWAITENATFVAQYEEVSHTHAYTPSIKKAATCAEAGTMRYTCTCGDYYDLPIPKLTTHTWGSWYTVTPAQVGVKGLEKRECQVCTAFETRDINPLPSTGVTISAEGTTVKISGATNITLVRQAKGAYTTGAQIKAAPGNTYYKDATLAGMISGGVFTVEVDEAGTYTFLVKCAEGEKILQVTIEETTLTPSVSVNALNITIKGLVGIKNVLVAKGDLSTYAQVKANMFTSFTQSKLGTKTSNTITVSAPGTYTIYIKYNDTTKEDVILKAVVDILVPTYQADGLQLKMTNLTGVKTIRRAYGTYDSYKAIKAASGVVVYTPKAAKIDAQGNATLQLPREGTVTIAVQYTNGYVDIHTYTVEKKVPTVQYGTNNVTFSNLQGFSFVRFCKGTYKTANGIKNAGATTIKEAKNNSVSIGDLSGAYSFLVQYADGSQSIYNHTF